MIALTAILKDDSEIELAKRMLKSFTPYVDGVFIALTGTSGKFNKLKRLITEYKGEFVITTPQNNPKIYTKREDGTYFFSNFAEARNVSWSIVPNKFNYLLWADVDDVLIEGQELKEVEKLMDTQKLDAMYFNYWYSVKLNENGEIQQVSVEHYRERLLRRGIYHWKSRLHEVCLPVDPNYKPRTGVWTEKERGNCVWCHLTNDDRFASALERNESILTIQAEEEEYKDPRTLFYLAKVLFERNTEQTLSKAIPLLEKYLELSGWDAERANACEYLGLIYVKKKEYLKAIEWFHRGIKEYPENHLLYLRLSSAYYDIGQDQFGDHWLDLALKFDLPKATATIQNTEEIKLLAITLKYIQARRRNDLPGMLEWSNRRAGLIGKDDGLLEEVKTIDNLNKAAQGVFNFCKWLKDNKYDYKIREVVSLLPREIGQLPAISFLATREGVVKTWGDKSIVYYASFGGPHYEKWGADSINKGGIGGSETAVIRLSEAWAKKGYEVTVFADVEKEEVKNGVHWLPYYAFNWNDNFNILILWRSPHLVEHIKKARKLFVDLHDIASQLDWTDERMKKVDKVFFKSEWHRTNVPKLQDKKAVVISNGIQL